MNEQQTRACFLLARNWTKNHIRIIFKDSPLGHEYFLDKLNDRIDDCENPTEAFCLFVLDLDSDNLALLHNFLKTYR